jgi:methionyl-tRNA formyltransferase
VAYGALVPQQVLDIPRYGWVNLHFSLLPAWRGAAPVQHAVLAGDTLTGASTFQLVAELDAGPIYGTVTDTISPTDTAGDVLTRLSLSGAALLTETMNGIAAGTLTATPQPDEGITLAPKINVEDARIDWQQPAAVIDRLVRGCFPAPGAWTTFRGDRFKLNSARPQTDDSATLAPGELLITKRSVQVGTGSHPLELDRVQAQGKKPMNAADWARGLTFTPGERLGNP